MPQRPNARFILIALSCAIATPVTAVLAAGGGGGGGGSMPSESVPQYDPAAEYAKGVEALKAKDYTKAKRAFDRVVAAAPKDANAQFLAGMSRTGLSDWKGARKFLEKAVKLDPKMIRAHRELGVTYAKLGDKAKAQATLTALKAHDASCGGTCGDAPEIKAAITAVSAALGGTTAATHVMEPGLMFASGAAGNQRYLAAVSLINEGRYEAAIDQLKTAQSSFGPHPDILTYLGFANRKLGRLAVAEDYYQSALSVAPAHRGATEYYGELMVERGNLAGAKAMLARLEAQCQFGCAEADELRRWIVAGRSPHS
jgi:Flp pilus assembly protein TadD